MSFAVISYPSLVLCQAHDIDRHAARFDGWFFHEADARAVYDLDEAMRRAEKMIAAGCDGIFIEAPRSVKELEIIGKTFGGTVPQICNPLMGGHTPILSMDELGQLGFHCAVLGLDTVMHAAKARRGHLYLHLGTDVPWVADHLQRTSPAAREHLHRLFVSTLLEFEVHAVDITGTWREREASAIAAIHAALRTA